MNKRVIFVAALLVLGAIASVRAAAITVGNPSFEVTILADGQFIFDPMVNAAQPWVTSPFGTGGFQNPTTGNFSAVGLALIDGQNVAFSNGGTISQVLADTLAADTLYTLSVLVGDRSDVTNANTDWAI